MTLLRILLMRSKYIARAIGQCTQSSLRSLKNLIFLNFQKLGVMKQARTQETIYNPSFFATEANQQNGLLHEVKATLH